MGGMLTQHVTADKRKSASKYFFLISFFPYSSIADAFIYYCLPLLIAPAEVHQSSLLILAVKPSSYAVMWLTTHLADFSFGVCVNCSPGIHAGAATFRILSISELDFLFQRLHYGPLEGVGCGIHHRFSLMPFTLVLSDITHCTNPFHFFVFQQYLMQSVIADTLIYQMTMWKGPFPHWEL